MNFLYNVLFVSDAGYWIGAILLGLAGSAVLWMVTSPETRMGPDPVILLSEAVTEEIPIVPALPVKPNYMPDFRLAEFYPMAPDNTVTSQLLAVAAFLERTEITVTREVVITIPGPRHRLEDVHAETQGITRAQIARVLEAGRPQ